MSTKDTRKKAEKTERKKQVDIEGSTVETDQKDALKQAKDSGENGQELAAGKSGQAEETEETKKKETLVNRVQQETRIYDVMKKETRIMPKHKWIGEEEDPFEAAGLDAGRFTTQLNERMTAAGLDQIANDAASGRASGGTSGRASGMTSGRASGMTSGRASGMTQVSGSDTRIMDMRSRDTRVVRRSGAGSVGEAASGRRAGAPAATPAATPAAAPGLLDRIREIVRALRNVRVADRKKFGRFIKVIGVLLIILLLEIGYFGLASHTSKMPAETEEIQKETELTKKEIKILNKEIENLGDVDTAEEQKQSWEKLKKEVEDAVAETYY